LLTLHDNLPQKTEVKVEIEAWDSFLKEDGNEIDSSSTNDQNNLNSTINQTDREEPSISKDSSSTTLPFESQELLEKVKSLEKDVEELKRDKAQMRAVSEKNKKELSELRNSVINIFRLMNIPNLPNVDDSNLMQCLNTIQNTITVAKIDVDLMNDFVKRSLEQYMARH